MKIISKLTIILVLASAFIACRVLTPQPTPTSLPTPTPGATYTSPPTAKPTDIALSPTATPTIPVLDIPTGKPVANWEGFPIMPEAIAGDGHSRSYTFTIKASVEQVQQFYEKEIAKLGWNLFASEQSTTEAALLFFMKGSDILTLSIIPLPDGVTYVLLVK